MILTIGEGLGHLDPGCGGRPEVLCLGFQPSPDFVRIECESYGTISRVGRKRRRGIIGEIGK